MQLYYLFLNPFPPTQISFQMQQLLEQPLHSDSWSPVKIKFNWDASYWTKQISSFGTIYVLKALVMSPHWKLLFILFTVRLTPEIKAYFDAGVCELAKDF